jgi:broad specificity phosphatase PhoE
MNEYLGGADGGKHFGASNFTDVFSSPDRRKRYHDTPLSPAGCKQAEALANKARCPAFVKDCELVVVSPLTRALQTYEIGLKTHFDGRNVPVVALPEAAERLYLISDVGRSVAELKTSFSYVDFETGFRDRHDDKTWWYQAGTSNAIAEEWRPVGKGQQYACPGEPMTNFNLRMSRFYAWLEKRPEKNIAVVCHHGVIDWMLNMDFSNCQHRQVWFSSIQPRELVRELPAVRR